jgi:hypothetical protein
VEQPFWSKSTRELPLIGKRLAAGCGSDGSAASEAFGGTAAIALQSAGRTRRG